MDNRQLAVLLPSKVTCAPVELCAQLEHSVLCLHPHSMTSGRVCPSTEGSEQSVKPTSGLCTGTGSKRICCAPAYLLLCNQALCWPGVLSTPLLP